MNVNGNDYGFGPHLMLNCFGCPKERTSDVKLISRLLNEFPAMVGLERISPPYVYKFSNADPEEKGISGVCLITRGHISIHTFSDGDRAFIDVFSHKDFDANFATDHFKGALGAKSHDAKLLNREFEYKEDISAVMNLVTGDVPA